MKYRKTIILAVLISLTAFLYAGSLSISSVSFSDSLGNPITRDYGISSYKVVGKYMPNQSTISGQFTKDFSSIPMTIDNLENGDNWKIRIYAFNDKGELIGQSKEITTSIGKSTKIDITIIVDTPTITLNEPLFKNGGVYSKLSNYYDIAEYKLTLSTLDNKEKSETVLTTFPYSITELKAGDYILSLEAIDIEGQTIASSGNLYLRIDNKRSIDTSIVLKVKDRNLSFSFTGISEENGYIYLDDSQNFSVKANITPLTKNADVSYTWYINNNGEWKKLDNANKDTIYFKDLGIDSNIEKTFSILCVPTIDNRSYKGRIIYINPIPKLTPMLFVTGTVPTALDNTETTIDITTVLDSINLKIEIPTYYLGKGIKAYYSLDGKVPNETSNQLIIGNSISISTENNALLRILLITEDGEREQFNVNINIKRKAEAPSIFISNRDYGNDLYTTLSTSTEGASIFYTLDGTEPTESSNLYTEPFKLGSIKDSTRTTIKAIAIKDGYEKSNVITMSI